MERRILFSAYTLSQLGSFGTKASGDYPRSNLVVDSNGNFYGTTVIGGPSNDGTVFEIAKGSGIVTTLASFNGTNGAEPYAGLTLDASGDLYGTTYLPNDGTVFEIAKGTGTITTLASFNRADGDEPMAGVTLDASGNLYGTTTDGGASGGAVGDGTVFEIAKGSGTITALASFNGTNGAKPEAGVTLDASGNLYRDDLLRRGWRRDLGDGTVFEIAKGSGTVTTLASFNGTNGANPVGGVTLDASGNLYGTTHSAVCQWRRHGIRDRQGVGHNHDPRLLQWNQWRESRSRGDAGRIRQSLRDNRPRRGRQRRHGIRARQGVGHDHGPRLLQSNQWRVS